MTESKPHTERPLSAAGLVSYRYRGFYDWIMIGARDDADAFREASRSTRDRLQPERLEVWSQDEGRYIQALKPVFQTQANTDGICAKIFELDKNFKVVAYDEKNEVRSGLCLWTSSLDEAKAYASQFGEPMTTGLDAFLVYAQQDKLANDAFASYDFGEGLTVVDSDGWQIETFDGKDDWTKVVYVECDDDEPNADSHKVSFHVAFARGTAILNEAYAYWCENGAEIGSPGNINDDKIVKSARMSPR